MSEESNGTPSFGQAALQHLDALYGFALILSHDRTEAQDLVQETYLRAVGAFSRLMPGSNLKSWLFTIMRNIWLNQLRHRRNGPVFVELDGQHSRGNTVDGSSADPYINHVTKVAREEILSALEKLPQVHREVIVLRHFEGFSYQQISEVLGCPAGTVMSRLGRARKKLRALLGRQQSDMAVKMNGAIRS